MVWAILQLYFRMLCLTYQRDFVAAIFQWFAALRGLSDQMWSSSQVCSHIFWKTESLLQSALFSISLVVIPALAAVEVEAPQTEWALKMLVSILDLARMDLIHLAMVDDVTGL